MISRSPDDGAKDSRGRKPAAEAPLSRELPHNLELELAILAVLLDGRHATAMHKVRQVVQHPLAFFKRDHRIVYLACLELDDGGHRVDAQACAELLSRYDFRAMLERLRQQQLLLDNDQLDALGRDRLRSLYRRPPEEGMAGYDDSALAALGGHNALAEIAASFAPAAGLERNVVLLWDYYLKRRLISRLQALCDKAYRTPDTFPQLLDQGGQSILDLGRFNQSSSVHGIGTVMDETIDEIGRREENPDQGVRTGFAELDKRLIALRPGGLYVLAARPGAGKTSFALNLVQNIAGHADHPSGVLFFSLEVDRVDLAKKLISAVGHLDFRAIESGALKPDEHEKLGAAAQSIKGWKLDLMDVSDLTVNTLRSVVRRRMLESNNELKLVVIDYLQLLSGARPDMSEYEKVSEISRILKVLARELRIPVIALSQMSRDSEKGAGDQPREPRLSDLRGSGTIEQDADAVIFIHHDRKESPSQPEGEEECRSMKIIIAKNRFGPTGITPMHFFPATMRFSVMAESRYGSDDTQSATPRNQRKESVPSDDEDVF